MSLTPNSPTFYQDLLVQNLTFVTVAGTRITPFTAFDEYYRLKVLMGIFFGLRVGCSAVVGIILFLTMPNKKTPVFIFNQITLWIFFIQSSLYLGYLTSSYSVISTNFTGSFASVTQHDINVSIATSVFNFLIAISIQFSLFFQVRVVFPPFSLSRLVASLVIGVVALFCGVMSLLFLIDRCYSAVHPGYRIFGVGSHFTVILPSINQYSLLCSIVVCCVILVGKLLFAIRTRHILGLRQFGPLQIIVIMCTQSMVLPVIMYIVNNTVGSTSSNQKYVSGIGALAPLIVVISLPMSAMWASASNISAMSRQEMTFSNRAYRSSDACVCGRPRGPDDDFDSHSYSTAINSAQSYYESKVQQPAPSGFIGKTKHFFQKIEFFLFQNIISKACKSKKASSSLANRFPMDESEKYVATTQLSISNIQRHPSSDAGIGSGNPTNGRQNIPFSITPGRYAHQPNQVSSYSEESPKTPSTLCSPYTKYYFDKGSTTSVGNSPTNPNSNTKEKGTSVSVHKVSSHSDIVDADNTTPFTSHKSAGIIITRDEISSPTDTLASGKSPLGSRKYSVGNSSNKEESKQGVTFVEDDDDLLSLDGDENEEEYYNRMKSKYSSH